MADNNTNKAVSTSDVVINAVYLINSSGKQVSLKNIFNVINIYEDIFSSSVSGTIQLIDGVDAISDLGIHGTEFLYISFNRPGETADNLKYKRAFRIYKAANREPNGSVQSYVLHFCSEEQVFSNQQTISKTFKNGSPTDYIKSVCTGILKTNKAKINDANFEKALGATEYVLTRYKPFEAIKLFTENSYNVHESPFMFFENRDGYNFLSIESMFDRTPITTLNYNTAKMTRDQTDAAFKNSTDITRFSFDSVFDVLNNTKNSAYSGRLYTLDLLKQKYSKNDYSAINRFNQKSLLDDYFPINDARNRNDKTMFEEYGTDVNFWLTNYNQSNSPYLASKLYRVNNTNVEKTLLQRKMQLQLLKNTVISCGVAGNPLYSPGYVINFNMPAFTPNKKSERLLDPYHSGKYLITNVRHVITPSGGLQTYLQMAKNSVSAPYDSATNSKEYKLARDL